MLTDLPFDLFILMLRVAFIFLLYFFLFQIIRVISRELQTPAVAPPRAAAPAGPALTLVDAGESELVVGATFSLKPTTTIGRSSDNVIILPDAFVSSHHARLVNTNGRWYFTDLGSTNGSFVNSQRATASAQLVKDGDILQIGRVKLRLVAY
jgi:pSer/pThr/pTyr-binding forkhead associated (FHA) protein